MKQKKNDQSKNASSIARPPIVTLMGHVNHGKTSLLDKIRHSQLQLKEDGGITQHTDAYQISYQNKKITFIDTPGHKLFKQMRARGAKITDLVVLVIAADEGIMAQTKECLKHIQEANVPYLIALNKIDLASAKPEEVKNKLTQFGVVTEERGGQVVLVPVSAKTGEGIKNLLEMILLMAAMADLSTPKNASLEAFVVEAGIDKRCGPIATVIVKNGFLTKGQDLVCQGQRFKVRALFDDRHQAIDNAVASQPVLLLGFDRLPQTGDLIFSAQEDKGGREVKEKTAALKDGIGGNDKETYLRLIIKTDTQGTKEAIINSLSDREDLMIVAAATGDINDADIFLASSSQAEIMGFHVGANREVMDLANREGVVINIFEIVYKLIEMVEEKIATEKEKRQEEAILGKAEIVADFTVPVGRVAGAKTITGAIEQGAEVTILRNDKELSKTKIVSLRHKNNTIRKAETGREFGALFFPMVDFAIGDMIIYEQPEDIKKKEEKGL